MLSGPTVIVLFGMELLLTGRTNGFIVLAVSIPLLATTLWIFIGAGRKGATAAGEVDVAGRMDPHLTHVVVWAVLPLIAGVLFLFALIAWGLTLL
jgi:hypothetical protein